MDTTSPENAPLILTINGGSSSIKYAVFRAINPPRRMLSGQIERVGQHGTRLVATREGISETETRLPTGGTFGDAVATLVDYLRDSLGNAAPAGIGHRVVHGGVHLLAHQIVTTELLAELRRARPLDLTHLPREIELIETFRDAFPGVPQVACFDTAFFRDLPRVAQILPIPRRYFDAGIRRFGFHGLSYSYLMIRLSEVAGPVAALGRVILAHLGSGASMAAVMRGKPIDTTMAFTPTAGLVMGTRPGDLDPGLVVYLMREGNRTADQMDEFISRECGLLGVSETSADTRDLIARRATDARAADAIDLFCYQARKFVGALHAALGGLDTLVFSGGIGEHSPEIREKICAGLQCIGIELDSRRNLAGDGVISTDASRVVVRVIPTDEEWVIARAVHTFVL